MKTHKPRKIALYTAVIIAAIASLLTGGFLYYFKVSGFYLYSLSLFLIVGFIGYQVINYSLDRFFYQNIRVIYRNVLQLKTSPSSAIPLKISDDHVLIEINRILIEWERNNKEEIVHLKELEVFRKEFLGNVSHELKTPIFTIQGYIHTLLDGGIEDQEINVLYLQKAARSIDRLISIVDDLESISKLEAGELILEHRTFDIKELIADVIESLELKAKENKVILFLKGNPIEKNYVFADKERIRQVLVNLLVNSIKYGRRNGHTSISVEDQGDFFVVEVQDDGIGIEKQHLGRLFERFYRVDKSRSREQGGTGLGLAIVKHIIEAHSEKISVESKPGEGTKFTFTLKKSR
ncbi:MAG: sensor histidine kinase [Bacteroidetes bacterium]|nr:sensor histidine kinase [Bacteroidota bacterium]